MKINHSDQIRRFFEGQKKNILLLTHQFPDCDAIGSVLAFYHQLKRMNHFPVIWSADFEPAGFEFMPGHSEIKTEFPAIDFDAVVVLDASNLNRIFEIDRVWKSLKRLPIVNIDHHKDNQKFGTINLIEDISSVGELLFHLFQDLGWTITRDMAVCLYAAICTDTGRFLFGNVTAQTFEAAAALMKIGIDLEKISQHLYENKRWTSFEMIKMALDNLVIKRDLGIVYTTLRQPLPDIKERVIDFIRQLGQAKIILVFQEHDRDIVKVSLRSKNDFDVSAFARRFSGGGHKKASGITMKGSIETVETTIIRDLVRELEAS